MIKRGLTLVELMVVVFVLAILAAIGARTSWKMMRNGRDTACKSNIAQINKCLELYNADTEVWPDTLEDFLEDTVYFPDGPPECPMLTEYKWEGKEGKKGSFRVKQHKSKDHEAKAK